MIPEIQDMLTKYMPHDTELTASEREYIASMMKEYGKAIVKQCSYSWLRTEGDIRERDIDYMLKQIQ